MEKGDVNGKNQQEIFKFLKCSIPYPEDRTPEQDMEDPYGVLKGMVSSTHVFTYAPVLPSDIKWNFDKFVIDKEGNVVHRFSPKTASADLEKYIEALL